MTELERIARDIAWELFVQFGPLTVLIDERYQAIIVIDSKNHVIFAKQAR